MLAGAFATVAALYVARAVCPNPAAAFPSVICRHAHDRGFYCWQPDGGMLGWLVGVAAVLLRLRAELKGKAWLRPLRWQSFLSVGLLAGGHDGLHRP